MIYGNTDEIIEELFESVRNRYQIRFETSSRGSDFIFDYVNLLHYKCHKINLKCDGSNLILLIGYNAKKVINFFNKSNNKCFPYDATVALNYEEIEKHSEGISKIKSIFYR